MVAHAAHDSPDSICNSSFFIFFNKVNSLYFYISEITIIRESNQTKREIMQFSEKSMSLEFGLGD